MYFDLSAIAISVINSKIIKFKFRRFVLKLFFRNGIVQLLKSFEVLDTLSFKLARNYFGFLLLQTKSAFFVVFGTVEHISGHVVDHLNLICKVASPFKYILRTNHYCLLLFTSKHILLSLLLLYLLQNLGGWLTNLMVLKRIDLHPCVVSL